MIRPLPPGWTRPVEVAEESIDLTPGVVWTDSQLAVVRSLLARACAAEAKVQAVREVAADFDDGSEWGMMTHSGDLVRRTILAALDVR